MLLFGIEHETYGKDCWAVILIVIPFIEQVERRSKAAARVFRANAFRSTVYILLMPEILASLLIVLVRTLAIEVLPVSRTPSLGVMMEPEV